MDPKKEVEHKTQAFNLSDTSASVEHEHEMNKSSVSIKRTQDFLTRDGEMIRLVDYRERKYKPYYEAPIC